MFVLDINCVRAEAEAKKAKKKHPIHCMIIFEIISYTLNLLKAYRSKVVRMPDAKNELVCIVGHMYNFVGQTPRGDCLFVCLWVDGPFCLYV